MAVRLLVADDEADVRLLVRLNLALYDDLEIVAEATDGRQAACLAAEHRPDVVVLDWAMPQLGGIEALPLIRRCAPGSQVLMYTSRPCPQGEEEALAAGAHGYLEKTAGIEALVSAVRRLAANSGKHHRGPSSEGLAARPEGPAKTRCEPSDAEREPPAEREAGLPRF